MATCTGPGPCKRPSRAKGLCVGHLWQGKNKGALTPLRPRGDGSRVVLSLRVDPEVKVRALEDPDGARTALGRWANTQPKAQREPME